MDLLKSLQIGILVWGLIYFLRLITYWTASVFLFVLENDCQMPKDNASDVAHEKLAFEGAERIILKETGYVYIT